MATYKEKLSHPAWQKKRLDVMQRDRFSCIDCGATDKELHIHHLYYINGKKPQDYPLSAYKTLCFECHQLEEDNIKRVEGTLMQVFRSMEASSIDINLFTIAVYDYLETTNEQLFELSNILRTITKELKKSRG